MFQYIHKLSTYIVFFHWYSWQTDRQIEREIDSISLYCVWHLFLSLESLCCIEAAITLECQTQFTLVGLSYTYSCMESLSPSLIFISLKSIVDLWSSPDLCPRCLSNTCFFHPLAFHICWCYSNRTEVVGDTAEKVAVTLGKRGTQPVGLQL